MSGINRFISSVISASYVLVLKGMQATSFVVGISTVDGFMDTNPHLGICIHKYALLWL